MTYSEHELEFTFAKKVMQTCWEQIGEDVIDRTIGQFRERLSFIVATS